MINLALGIIIGILVRDIKFGSIETVKKVKSTLKEPDLTQFFEPITEKEKWESAKTVDDLLE